MSLVVVERDESVATVTLNRPEAMNALSTALRGELTEVFESLSTDTATDVVILTGSGRAFSAGLDLKELGGEIDGMEPTVSDDRLARAVLGLPHPIIAAINGFAITGGFELALMCDILIASTEARFADTHARVGVVPGWGLSQRLPRLIGIARAKELSLTGNYLDAETAYAWGLVNRVVAPDELLPTSMSLAKDIASTDKTTRLEIKRIMDQGWMSTLGEGLAIEDAANRAHADSVTPEKVRARRAAIQRRGRKQS